MLTTIISAIVTAILGWLSRYLQVVIAEKRARDADEAINNKLKENLKNAKTKEELEAAAAAIAARL